MTNLITTTELKTQARLNGLALIQNDTDLETQIATSQNELEVRTGRKFNVQTITEYFNRVTGSLIQLHYYPITSITTLTIDDTTYTSTDYELNINTGSIYLNTAIYSTGNDNNIEVTYTTKAPEDATLAKALCADMTLYSLKKYSMDKDSQNSIKTDLNDRIKRLAREIIMVI